MTNQHISECMRQMRDPSNLSAFTNSALHMQHKVGNKKSAIGYVERAELSAGVSQHFHPTPPCPFAQVIGR